ncbi:hypothetical protein JXL19_04095 [bacterium]|nr:hypothetical protein [bacterium]
MPKLLKPIKITDHKYLIKIFGESLNEEEEWSILDQELGSPQRGTIDLLGVDPEKRANIITIGTKDIEQDIVRCFRGYRWFKENQEIMKRIFSPQKINYDLSVKLVLFLEQDVPDASKMVQELCRVPIDLYRYLCFGPNDNPSIYIEPLDSQRPVTAPPAGTGDKTQPSPQPEIRATAPPDIEEIKKRLKIELADLNEKEIQEFLDLDMP